MGTLNRRRSRENAHRRPDHDRKAGAGGSSPSQNACASNAGSGTLGPLCDPGWRSRRRILTPRSPTLTAESWPESIRLRTVRVLTPSITATSPTVSSSSPACAPSVERQPRHLWVLCCRNASSSRRRILTRRSPTRTAGSSPASIQLRIVCGLSLSIAATSATVRNVSFRKSITHSILPRDLNSPGSRSPPSRRTCQPRPKA